ncbi:MULTISPECIES: helix-turn-helix transcriptional regulator [Acinetobacter]|jgi:predicted DNA-binding transcriptional regulator AlpA|uniref:AlpA family phage regulatory protein n=2 Tax=Acinetobacter TaxID=469 RepID=A0A7T7WKG7_9GAMM|nr:MULTISPECIES: AlpA family phage regulatory protein [Acinetobacter]AZM38536.1 AlpA family phage regulatory protein [Acinetobacter baumannii]AUC05471.1 AlpA family phage regulatory protein [Acinetobacter lwoffii]MBK0412382.1 AlpA family phage regulatory protein [Acinetobacter pittii]MBK1418459.1 AlpA family phage regulatory protein [Acinetobacter pittii]MDM1274651.1 AlpA family phage regulatory protein [Acinetobacter indicus]
MDCVIDRNESNLIENTEQTEVLNIVQIKPFLLSYNTVCKLLGIERNALRRLMKKDDRFPKPLKMGLSRQAAVYFDREEIEAWYQGFKERCRGQNEKI